MTTAITAADDLLRRYLEEVARVRATGAGTGETSFYGALQGALNAIGDSLRPGVFALPQLSGGAAGYPDFGLFVEQRAARPTDWSAAAAPERGVVEADDVDAPLTVKRGSIQVAKYLAAYGLVMVTNFRDFELLEHDASSGVTRVVEQFSFGLGADAFFAWARAPRRAVDITAATSFAEFLFRALSRRAPLAEPRDVAALLASYAREALSRASAPAALPSLAPLREALGTSLGLRFAADAKGEHFFRSTLVQTLFYGLFSAWATHARSSGAPFDWRTAAWSLNVPAVRALFEQVATPARLGALDLVELLGWASEALNRVDRTAFFARFGEGEAVQHFYEPFLAAYDPALRKTLGVWYTPGEVVRYMVERVDRALRDELGVVDGLADSNVFVLDPCTGTGSYVLEVLRRIRRTLEEKGVGATLGAELKAAATGRVAGFEVLPAPFVIAHWQVDALLANAGAPLNRGVGERAAIYLTNALTGWDAPAAGPPLPFPELEEERDLAGQVKRDQPILVVIGNPPYSAFAGTATEEEGNLVGPYKQGLRERWRVKKFNLDELYVRFFRLAERRIERTGRGVVCLITNASYLGYRSFTVMRERLVSGFDAITIDAMNGDSRQTGKLTPDGRPDPSVFSTPFNPEGIQVGTAIATFVRRDSSAPKSAVVAHRDFWGATKRTDLETTLDLPRAAFAASYVASIPQAENRFKLAPDATLAIYRAWPSLSELAATVDEGSGLLEKRGGALMAHDSASISARMQRYCDPSLTFATLQAEGFGLARERSGYRPERTRTALLAAGGLAAGRFTTMTLHPFDQRWVFHTDVSTLWNRSRPGIAAQHRAGGKFVLSRVQSRRMSGEDDGVPVFFTSDLPGDHTLDPNTRPIPTLLYRDAANGSGLALQGPGHDPNLSARALEYLSDLGLTHWASPNHSQNDAVWMSALAVAYASAWLEENEEGILDDWPRVPLPAASRRLLASATLGRRVAGLLDLGAEVVGVTTGVISRALREVAVVERAGGTTGALDLAVDARWGARDARGAVMPGPGKTEQRAYGVAEASCAEHAALLGPETVDVYLNAGTYWRNVPTTVWEFTVGGFQVLKKWLSYRERAVLGRPMTLAEVNHFRDVARRIAALRLMTPALDRNYRRCADASYPWRTISVSAAE